MLKYTHKEKERKIKMKKIKELEIGDVLYSRFGYETSTTNFYQVVGKTEKTVTLREVKSKTVGYLNQSYSEVQPIKDDFVNTDTYRRKIVKLSNEYALSLNDYEYLYVYGDEVASVAVSNY